MASLIQDPSGRSPYWICICSSSTGGPAEADLAHEKDRVKPLAGAFKPDGDRVTARDLRLKAEQVCRAIERSIQLERRERLPRPI